MEWCCILNPPFYGEIVYYCLFSAACSYEYEVIMAIYLLHFSVCTSVTSALVAAITTRSTLHHCAGQFANGG